MKRTFTAIVGALLCALPMSARTTEVSASYGALPAMQSLGVYHHDWHNLDPWGTF